MAKATGYTTAADVHDGTNGINGTNGTNGVNGADGANTYFHIAYADDAIGTGFNQSPTGKTYVGTYVDTTLADSTTVGDYTWALYVGADGSNGLAGTNGADGSTSYFHVAYADDAIGTGFNQSPTGKTYIGTYVDTTLADSTTAGDYTWALYVGADGTNGTNGTNGVNGADGAVGARGNRQLTELVASVNLASGGTSLATSKSTSNPWQSSGNISATLTQGLKVSNWVKNNSPGFDGTLVLLDTVTVYDTTNQWSATRFYNGTDWVRVDEVIDGNLLVTGTVAGTAIVAGSVTADRLILNSAVIEADGNSLTLVGAALNRTHSFVSGTTTIEIPYGASDMIMTGCGSGGGRAAISVTTAATSLAFAASGGGGGACLNLAYVIPVGTTHIRVIVGAGVSGGAGSSTVVQTATSVGGTYSTRLTLGGGGIGQSLEYNWSETGADYTSITGGSAGTSSGTAVVEGFTYDGQVGTGGQLALINNRSMTWKNSGGEAGTGTNSPLGDWPHGSSPSSVTTDTVDGYWNYWNYNYGPSSLGFGCGAPQANAGGRNATAAFTWPAMSGGNGYMIISFGA